MNIQNEIKRLHPDPSHGLTDEELLIRQQQGLTNIVEQKITKSTGEIFKDNILTLFNGFNLIIGIGLALVGAYSNMFFLLIILINISIGIYQELHAKKLVENLSIISSLKVDVCRNGQLSEIPIDELVLDDITILEMGKQICADSIVVNGEIEVNESHLTGEANPIPKREGDTLLSGSFIVSGKCYARVDHVGADNFATKLSLEAKKHKVVTSELLSSMKKLTKLTSFFIIPIGAILFYQGFMVRQDPLNTAVVSTAAALLGMLPKGLVLLISIALATGIINLSKKRVLVQELYSVETLAHVDMLCLDKTGTITEGKMSVSNVYPIEVDTIPITFDEAIGNFIGNMDDNNATFLALKDHFTAYNTKIVVSKVPFSSSRKWSSITFESLGSIIIGAPEKLLAVSHSSVPGIIHELQDSGRRALCVGFSPDAVVDNALPNLTLIGAIDIDDPIRENVKETLDFFKAEGVEVKIISGDNPLTVSNIARQAGIETYKSYIDMSQVSDDSDFNDLVYKYTVFGRVTPSQKNKLVKALKENGHTVAMTGDGVNDVLALKEADCGIAMAAGSDAATQVAQIVLLDSDFTSLPDVVMEGRRVVNNVTRVSGIFFIKTIYSILLSFYCMITQTPFPFIPIQITLIDLAIEGYPSLFMSFEPIHDRIKGSFLGTAIRRALPFALTIIILILAINEFPATLSIPYGSNVTVMYYVTGFTSVLAVLQACVPFNKLRAFLFTTVSIGYFVAVLLFTHLLQLEPLTKATLSIILILAAVSVLLTSVFYLITNKVFSKRSSLEIVNATDIDDH